MKTEFNSVTLSNDLKKKIKGKVLFDEFSRGRYSTDASLYQIKPIGVVLPKDQFDVLNIIEYSQKNSIPLLARGGGSSQCGQTVGECIVLDYSRYQNKILEFNAKEKFVWVEPGIVLDQLNEYLKPHGLWFPVDVSTSSRATIGGMTGNNSCGSRSLYYGNMVNNVIAVESILDDGSVDTYGTSRGRGGESKEGPFEKELGEELLKMKSEYEVKLDVLRTRLYSLGAST